MLFIIYNFLNMQYLAKLDVSRAESNESITEVAIALLSIDRMLGTENSNNKEEIDEAENKETDTNVNTFNSII